MTGELRQVIAMFTGAAVVSDKLLIRFFRVQLVHRHVHWGSCCFRQAAEKVFQGSVGAATLQIGATNIGHDGYLISSVENDSSCSVFLNS
jgi:hypothetical protein